MWADDVAGGIFDLLAAYPGRAPYRLDHVLPSGQPHALRTPLLVPQTVDEGPGLDVHLRFTSPVAGAGLTSFVHVGPVDRFIGMAESAKVGASYDVTFHLTPSSFGSEDTVTLGAADREGVIAFGVEVVTDRTERYEWRVPYRVSPNRVEIALPGAPWRLWAGTTPAVWLEEDVRPVLSLFSSAPVTAGVAGRGYRSAS